MYTNPIAASNGSATISFDYRGSQVNQSEYKDATAALDQPHTLKISHQYSGAALTRRRRTLTRIDRVVEDANGEQGNLAVYLVVDVPEGVATTAQVTEQVTLMKNHLAATGVIAKIVSADI
jgi:hypothetical protein